MTNESFEIAVNGRHTFELLPSDAAQIDVIAEQDGRFHILYNGKSWHAELEEADFLHRQLVFRIDGNRYSVHLADRYERLVQQLGLHIGGQQKQNTVKAPMPGLVLDILVTPGQTVQKGDPLLILEAMKMENVLKAASEGQVKSVNVQKGVAVDKGALLLEME
jgi:acetyl/propionyl-CoA carboxylase alpha subunit